MAKIAIKDAPLVEQLSLDDKFPISDGSGLPKCANFQQVEDLLGGGATVDTSNLATKDELNEVSDILQNSVNDVYKTIPTKISELKNDKNYLTEHQSLEHLATKIELQEKQDIITDLSDIRSGALKGLSALLEIPETYVQRNELNDYVHKVEGKQLSTEDFTTLLKQKLEGLINYNDTDVKQSINNLRLQFDTLVSGDASAAIESFHEIIAFLNGIEDSENLDSIIASIELQIAEKMDKITLATVATSGDYNDLSNKPVIPATVTESTISGWGFTKNTGTYSKPNSGIPKSDLTSTVLTSLGKADTALQSYTEQYKGTVTGVQMNGVTKNPTNGIIDLGTVITDISSKADKSVVGAFYKADWYTSTAVGISQRLTNSLSLPAGTYIVQVSLPYCSDMAMEICIMFSAKMSIGTGSVFVKACYGTVTMIVQFTATTNLFVQTAASSTNVTWSYLERGGLIAVRIA